MADDRLLALLEERVEGALDEAGRRELEELLISSPDARRLFWEYAGQHALLRRLMSERAGRRLARPARRWGWAAACAAALLAALVLVLWPRAELAPQTAGVEPSKAVPKPPQPPRPAPVPEPPAPPREPEPPPPPPTEPPPSAREVPKPPPEPDRPPPPPPAKPPPPPSPEPLRKTVAVVGTVERRSGDVFVVTATSRSKVAAKQPLAAGDGVETSARDGLAAMEYPDGTRLELGPQGRLRDLAEDRAILERGIMAATVARQPAGRTWLIQTPISEIRVVGTRLVVSAGREEDRVEVREGRVRLTRLQDRASADVAADQQATVAAKGAAPAARPSRAHADLVALYRFDEGAVDLVRDRSASGPPLDLEVRNPKGVTWKPTGLAIQSWTQIGSAGHATKIAEACRKSREVTLEAWVVPSRTPFEHDAPLLGMWSHPARNFSLSHHGTGAYQAQVRTSSTDLQGKPVLATPKGLADGRPTHLVYTRSANGAERIYVNGVARAAGVRGGDFSGWDDGYRLVVAVEWLGELRLAAVYARALKETEVARNIRVGLD